MPCKTFVAWSKLQLSLGWSDSNRFWGYLDQFGEENNAWVKWVSTPILCYYEPINTLKKVTVQLLVPRPDTSGCEQRLPVAIR